MNVITQKSKLVTFIQAAILVVVGILFCCSNAMGTQALSIIGGIIFIVLGALSLVAEMFVTRRVFNANGIGGSFMIAFGIFFIVANVMGQYLFEFLPLLLIVLGAVILLDGVLAIISNTGILGVVLELVIGAVALVLGCCLWCIADFRQAAGIVLGIILIVYAIILVVECFTSKTITEEK